MITEQIFLNLFFGVGILLGAMYVTIALAITLYCFFVFNRNILESIKFGFTWPTIFRYL